MNNIRLFKPSIGTEELNSIREVFDRSWIGLGPAVREFEDAWKDYLGCRSAYALNSATAALHLALSVFDFPRGKKVLLPSLTFSATASAALYNGLEPVFVDSDPETLGMCMQDLDAKYDEDCVAVIPVHFAGHPVEMDNLVLWARERNLKIIEDCAHTSGSFFKGQRLGLWGDIGCFSFEEKKLMTTGDGGMICSAAEEILSRIPAMRWVGIDKDNWKTAQAYTEDDKNALHWYYEINELGYKYNMNDLAASIGLVQLRRLDEMNSRRSEIIKRYLLGISTMPNIAPLLPYEPEKYVYQIFGIRVKDRKKLTLHLKTHGIATGCHYTPLTHQPLFRNYSGKCPYIESEIDKCLTLPLHADLTDAEVDYVLKCLSEVK